MVNKLSVPAIRDKAAQAGFRGDALRIAVAVAMAESGGDADIYNGTCCYGLWQINALVHKRFTPQQLRDPLINAKEAFRISSGGRNWRPWEAYTNNSYRKFLDDPGITQPDPNLKVGGTIGEAISQAAGLTNLASTARRLVAAITQGGTWIRFGLVLGGVVLLISGIGFIAADLGLSSGTVKKAVSLIPK